MAESSLFATSPQQPIDVMLLVENSHQMSCIWDDLRNRYLSTLMSRLQLATSEPIMASVTVWVLESQSTTASDEAPRPYSDPYAAIDNVRLSPGTENRISFAKVDEAAAFLESLRAEDQARSLHLIVVAASSPLTDAPDFSPWYGLAHKLGQANVHCHLLMPTTSDDMTALTTLFEETLRYSQNNLEDLVSFPVDANYAVRLSMSPLPGQFNPPPRPQRIPMPPRRNTFPLETNSQFDQGQQQQYHLQLQQQQLEQQQLLSQQAAQLPEGSPSLVSHLQQVHGLTKKKVYGVKPARKPFFRDEPYYDQHDPSHAIPHAAPMKGAVYSHDGTLPPSSGRAMTHSKADRLARLAHANPTDPQGRQYGTTAWARRIGGSRIASPEMPDSGIGHPPPLPTGSFSDLSSPPTSYLSSNLSSPVSPVSMDYGHVASVVNGGSPDPTWLQPAYSPSGSSYGSGMPQPPHSAPPTQQAYYPPPPPPAPQQHGMYPPEYPPVQAHGMPGPGMVVRSSGSPVNVGMSPPPIIPPPPGAATATSTKMVTPPPRSGASSVSSIPGTSATTTAATSTTTTPRSSKKVKPKAEEEEYIELDAAFVQNSTELFNQMFPNAGKEHDEKVKAAVEAGSGIGVGKARAPAAGVGMGAGGSGTGSPSSTNLAAASSTKAASRPASGAATTSSSAGTSSSKVAGGSKSPSTSTPSVKAKRKSSKANIVSKKVKQSGASVSPSMPPSTSANATTSASGAPSTSSAPTPTSLPSASTSTASVLPAPSSGRSTSMTTATATMGASDSGSSGNATGVGLGTGIPMGVGAVQEDQVYGIGVVGGLMETSMAKTQLAIGHGMVQVHPGLTGAGTAVLQPLMYSEAPQGSSGSTLGYAPMQDGLQTHLPHQYQQNLTHQLHQAAYMLPASHPAVTSPVVDDMGRYQHLAMAPPPHPSTHQVQYDDGSESGGYYPSSHYGESAPASGSMTPNSLAGWAG